ncbi:methyl-accepting chemotaxis protein [Falsiroseomonas sp. CW058]|uniref:methyl-accepting chemotaxis protein n=1 Tax=Falsiroseomonas sp. CW058 TaxID=3388664 RepID=UPI003D3113BC
MRLINRLSVGRKLAASAALALLLLVGLVGIVWHETAGMLDEQQDAARSEAARDRIDDGAAALRSVAVLERDLLLTQDQPGQAPARERLMARLEEGLALVVDGAGNHGDAAVSGAADPLARAVAAYRVALAALAEERVRLIRLRDDRLTALSTEYDSVFESVTASIGFDLGGDAQEDARQRVMTVHAAVNEVRLGVQRLLATGEETQVRRVRRGAAQARVHGRGLGAIEAPQRMKDDFARLADKAQAIAGAADDLLASGETVARIRQEQVQPARATLEGALTQLDAASLASAQRRRAELSATAQGVQRAALWTGLAIALVLVLSGLLMARAIGAPLRRLAGAMAAISAGDTSVAVPDRGRGDEIGAISAALETLRGTVGRAFAQGQMLEQLPAAVVNADPRDGFRITYMNAESHLLLARIAHLLPCPPDQMTGRGIEALHRGAERQRDLLSDPGRLPHTEKLRLGEEVLELRYSAIHDAAGGYTGTMLSWQLVTEKARLADTFETEVGAVVEAVAASAERLQGSASELSAAAETSGREAAAVSEAGSRAHSDVQSVAAAAEEMAASVTEIARQVGEAAEVASRAVSEARATDATVQGLSEAASRIGDVVRLIGDIAGQTNLLALNATIEAARAGEAGKGFAVVASEVKSLAGQTAKATEEIAAQIGQMQQATTQAVAAIRGIGATVERTSQIATAIAAAVEEQGAATQEIARSATQVAEATETVASRISGVRGAAEATGGSAAAMRDDSGALASQAAALREKAGSFLRAVRAM